jgi:hypothetical protein
MHRVTIVAPQMVVTLATAWDNQAFAFASDVTGTGSNQVSVVQFPTGDAGTHTAAPLKCVAAVTVPTLAKMDNAWTAAGGAAGLVCLGPFATGADNTEQLRARRLAPVPTRYIHLVLGKTLTP